MREQRPLNKSSRDSPRLISIIFSFALEVLESPILRVGETLSLGSLRVESSQTPLEGTLAFYCKVTESTTKAWLEFRLPDDARQSQPFAFISDNVSRCLRLTDNGCKGTGIFVKVIDPLQLKSNSVVSFSDSHLAIFFTTQER
jgi:hypothetical protein